MKNLFVKKENKRYAINTKSTGGKFFIVLISVFLLATLVFSVIAMTSGCNNIAGQDADVNLNRQNEAVNWQFYNERATAFITATANGDYDEAAEMFDATMTRLFGATGLQGAWADVIELTGAFIEIHGIENAEVDGYFISGVVLRHELFGFAWNVVFSEDGSISGLRSGGTIPLSELVAHSEHPATPVQRDGFTDYPIIIGENTDFPLNGILSMPDTDTGTVPAVIIVQGSGPSDMDGTLYGNKPYRDIADFLAANGIAVIRNDKRPYAHGARYTQELGGDATVWEEAIEDALFATELLRADPRIDENRIFIIGHSLGGMLAPRIYVSGGDFAGLILMAATPRSLTDLFIEQNTASLSAGLHEGIINEETMVAALTELDALADFFNTIAYMTVDEARTTPVPELGGWAYYIYDLDSYPFADYAEEVTVPFLVMQGGSDFQVLADVDYVLLQEIFAGRDNVTFKLYGGLDHMFMATPATNFVQHATRILESPGLVDMQVLQDIADWIHAR